MRKAKVNCKLEEKMGMCLKNSNKRPHHAVCCRVLNLPKQDGFLHCRAALAEAYRVALMIYGILF